MSQHKGRLYPSSRQYCHESNNNAFTRDVSNNLEARTPSLGAIPRFNAPVYLIETSIRFARSSSKFVSNSVKCKCIYLFAEHVSELVSNQGSPVTKFKVTRTWKITLFWLSLWESEFTAVKMHVIPLANKCCACSLGKHPVLLPHSISP